LLLALTRPRRQPAAHSIAFFSSSWHVPWWHNFVFDASLILLSVNFHASRRLRANGCIASRVWRRKFCQFSCCFNVRCTITQSHSPGGMLYIVSESILPTVVGMQFVKVKRNWVFWRASLTCPYMARGGALGLFFWIFFLHSHYGPERWPTSSALPFPDGIAAPGGVSWLFFLNISCFFSFRDRRDTSGRGMSCPFLTSERVCCWEHLLRVGLLLVVAVYTLYAHETWRKARSRNCCIQDSRVYQADGLRGVSRGRHEENPTLMLGQQKRLHGEFHSFDEWDWASSRERHACPGFLTSKNTVFSYLYATDQLLALW
jgi:hypothetical protein